MEKLQYEKPELFVIELNDDIILASGCADFNCGDLITCIGYDDCLGDGCTNYGCYTHTG